MLPLLVETANASIPTYGLLVGVAFMLAFYVAVSYTHLTLPTIYSV